MYRKSSTSGGGSSRSSCRGSSSSSTIIVAVVVVVVIVPVVVVVVVVIVVVAVVVVVAILVVVAVVVVAVIAEALAIAVVVAGDFILQQDGVILHTSRATQQFPIDQVVDTIAKDNWPPQFPDRLCGLAVKTLAQRSGVAGSIPGRVKPKTSKLVLVADAPGV
ncbi:hypothetical protein ElyMa_004122900 [Elysia marginata]|uniref:Uncharacterized protein n=1 Tax=Elysia marginata TaxID=1093978 RepID=A0AAV4GEI1_9GAST|nr:hypothetical protein ElyMa_004122900 [Elysia marginata]